MMVKRILPLLMLVTIATALPAQTPPRAQLLAGEFNKFKNSVKQKRGVTTRKFHEVKSEAWLTNASGYAGVYVSESPVLEIHVARDGSVTGSGVDVARFELRGVRIADALLTGTKVYADNHSEPFEAVFLRRADRVRPDQDFTVRYGIGFLAILPGSGADTPLRVFALRQ